MLRGHEDAEREPELAEALSQRERCRHDIDVECRERTDLSVCRRGIDLGVSPELKGDRVHAHVQAQIRKVGKAAGLYQAEPPPCTSAGRLSRVKLDALEQTPLLSGPDAYLDGRSRPTAC